MKYKQVYINNYQTGWEADEGIGVYMPSCNQERPQQAFDCSVPFEVYLGSEGKTKEALTAPYKAREKYYLVQWGLLEE